MCWVADLGRLSLEMADFEWLIIPATTPPLSGFTEKKPEAEMGLLT